jgi:hypothetical protein
MPVIRSFAAVLPEGAAELRHNSDDSVAPLATEFLRQSSKPTAQAFDVVG